VAANNKMLKSKLNIGLFIGAFCVTILGVVMFSRIRATETAAARKRVFLTEGFDFRQKRSLNPDFSEPQIGTRIDLADLQTSRQEKLSTLMKGDLLLIAVVDPECPACQISKDLIDNIHSKTDALGIRYLPMVLSKPPPDAEAQRYAEELGFETCLRWGGAGPPPISLKVIGTPTHVLFDKQGVVLQSWSGSNQDRDTRMRMSSQIASDLSLASDVIKALQTN